MRKLSENFQQHLQGEAISLCNCWRITRADGVLLGFTDHDCDLVIDGQTFEGDCGFDSSQIESSNGLAPDNHEVLGALQSGRISGEDILSRKYDNARIEHYLVNWNDVDERALMATYLFGEIIQSDGIFKAELKTLSATLDQTNMRRFERRCNATLGDAKCQVDLDGTYRAEGVVSKILKPDLIKVSGLNGFDAGWFSGGELEFLSGENIGNKIEVAEFSKTKDSQNMALLSLWEIPSSPLMIGDQIAVIPGCDKFFSTCKSKFSNTVNFRGFPHIPGSDFAMSYANNSNEMDGGALIS